MVPRLTLISIRRLFFANGLHSTSNVAPRAPAPISLLMARSMIAYGSTWPSRLPCATCTKSILRHSALLYLLYCLESTLLNSRGCNSWNPGARRALGAGEDPATKSQRNFRECCSITTDQNQPLPPRLRRTALIYITFFRLNDLLPYQRP